VTLAPPPPGPDGGPLERGGPRPAPRRAGLAAALILAAVGLAYQQVGSIGVILFDDGVYLTHNVRVLSGLTRQGVAWAFGWGDGRDTYFHPVTWLSLMADVELFGFRPAALHLENLALHAASALLLFFTALRATGRRWPSLGAALLFGLHPLTVEAVAWIAERKSVLATALSMGAVLLWVEHLRRPARWRVALAAGLFALGTLARPQLLLLPVLLLLLDLWPLRRWAPLAGDGGRFAPAPARRLLLEKWPFFSVAVASAALVITALPSTSATHARLPPLGYRLAQAVASIADYLGAVIWPSGLVIMRVQPEEVTAGALALGAALLLAITAVTAWQARRRPWWLFGWLWFLAALAPALGLVQTGVWPAWADRFAYAPLLGLSLAVAFGLAELPARWPRARWPVAAGAAAGLLALALATRAQVDVWQSSVELTRRAVAQQPWSADLRAFHGSALMNDGRVEEAHAEFREALRLDPGQLMAHLRIGEILERQGRIDEAADRYRLLLRLRPNLPDALFALGRLALAQGRLEEARVNLRRYVDLAPVTTGGSPQAAREWLRRLEAPAP
jgi:tetratricopeptide (TPR) repeat protein